MISYRFTLPLSLVVADIGCGGGLAAEVPRKPAEVRQILGAPSPGDKQELQAIRRWSGVFRNEPDQALSRQAPSRGFLSTDKEWATLWKAWRGSEPVPAIDFAKEIILVKTSTGPNSAGVSVYLDKKGNLTTEVIQTLIGGPGFGYTILSIARAGIKAIDGQALVQ